MCGLAENVDQQETEQSGWRGQGRDLKLQPAAGTGICFPNSRFSPELAAKSRAADVGLEAEFVPGDLQGKSGFVVETWSEGLGDALGSHNELNVPVSHRFSWKRANKWIRGGHRRFPVLGYEVDLG